MNDSSEFPKEDELVKKKKTYNQANKQTNKFLNLIDVKHTELKKKKRGKQRNCKETNKPWHEKEENTESKNKN